MQRGGFDIIPIKDSDFKYTIDPDRILWTKNVFPIAEYIIQAIQTIPWSTYSYSGTSTFWKVAGATYVSEDIGVTTAPVTSPLYYYFGGSVYEIMNKLFTRSGMPVLHNYVDPTGDLDVMLILPKLLLPEKKSSKDYYAYFFQQLPYKPKTRRKQRSIWQAAVASGDRSNNNNNNNNNTSRIENVPNAEPPEIQGCANNVFTGENARQKATKRDPRRYASMIDDYTAWVMDQFATNLKKYAKGGLFDLLFGNTVKFNLDNDAEGRYGDRIICIGNIKLVRSYLPYMNLIKLQLIAKFKGMNRSDHICEFLLDMPAMPTIHTTLERFENIKHKYHTLKGFPMSNFGELVRGNLDSLINRYSLFNGVLRHKFYNHVGRMQYLHDFFKNNLNAYYENDSTKLTLTQERYMDLGNNMAKFSFYVAENFFSSKLFHFDSKNRFREDMNVREMSELRESILQSLIGSYPKFLFRKGNKKVTKEFLSPFNTVSFEPGDTIPARTVFTLTYIFNVADKFPQELLDKMGRIDDAINTVQLFRILRVLGILTF